MHPNERRNQKRADLFAELREKERLGREEKEETLSSIAASKPLSKGATRKRSTKKRQTKRTSMRAKG